MSCWEWIAFAFAALLAAMMSCAPTRAVAGPAVVSATGAGVDTVVHACALGDVPSTLQAISELNALDFKGALPGRRRSAVEVGVYDPKDVFADTPDISIEHVFVAWEPLDRRMLRSKIAYASARHRQFMVTVEPWPKAEDWPDGANHLFADIVAGAFDQQITSVCREISAAEGHPIVRWGHEMEEPTGRYPWARTDAAGYVMAYRHSLTKCRQYAPEALFMWSPKGRPNLGDYYPGDAWVDVIGLSLYGLQDWDRRYSGRDRSFGEVFGEEYARVACLGKPIVIAELGVAGSFAYRQAWLTELLGENRPFPLLQSIVYFNDKEPSEWPDGFGAPDWRIVPTILAQIRP